MNHVLSRTERTDGRTIMTVTKYADGARTVCREADNGESWSQYVILPRSLVLSMIRRRRELGVRWHTMRYIVQEMAQCAPAGGWGPGQPFADVPYRMRSSRRWIVVYQRGGLDV